MSCVIVVSCCQSEVAEVNPSKNPGKYFPKETHMIYVQDLFADGNAFMLLGKCQRAARQAGWTPDRWTKLREEAMSGDYDHLLATLLREFDEKDRDDNDEE